MAQNQVQQQQQQGYGYGQQPVQQQPSSHNTTVVVNQTTVNQRQKSWTQGLFGCFDDCMICLCVTFCPLCASCQMAQDMGEFMCLACCVPNWMTAARTKIRMQRNIQGSICDDCCVTAFCGSCAMCQMWREVKVAKQNGEM
ncbi:cornifelin homolog [Littorina saxatilis]|uniref:Placenta-specific gene 8 protein n=1 Tax=Littorina saxatilis TaxID=31220 RepID=A0AAN9G231_9CAEN